MLTGRHGTKYRYGQGCRCELCREAQRLSRRRVRDRARAELRPAYLRELATSRAYKERIVGSCESCGAETRYNGHGVGASRRCATCTAAVNGPRRYRELRDALGITSDYASPLLNREVTAGRIVRVSRGVYALPAAGRREGVEAMATHGETEPS